MIRAAIQSISVVNLLKETGPPLSSFLGNPHTATTRMRVLRIDAMWKPHLHPMLSENMPPKVRPMAKPTGWPPPIAAKAMFRCFPGTNAVVIILTAEGRQSELATPAKPRNSMSWPAVPDRPHASVNMLWKKLPRRYMNREPTTSATLPARVVSSLSGPTIPEYWLSYRIIGGYNHKSN